MGTGQTRATEGEVVPPVPRMRQHKSLRCAGRTEVGVRLTEITGRRGHAVSGQLVCRWHSPCPATSEQRLLNVRREMRHTRAKWHRFAA